MAEVQQRSTFITVVAWVFIVLSGFATVISVLQNIMIQTMFRGPEIGQGMRVTSSVGLPIAAAFMAEHVHLFFLAFLVLSIFTLACSIGLLKRRNWARLGFVGIMVLAIVWNLGGLVLQFSLFASMQDQLPGDATRAGMSMGPFLMVMMIVNVLLAIGLSVLFGWIAGRLLSPAVREEFTGATEM
ncbi:hypothetical protein [Dokdonella sp.]|uniref:hypothetical protein n=1 Tax=Dokdonella sp. TaxID=2291710 RepID=UPI001B235EB7|nr:hypothetical protein [Dokdonella sp.]MBO9664053.1 hypothetical protein [Dokdonella sp.]